MSVSMGFHFTYPPAFYHISSWNGFACCQRFLGHLLPLRHFSLVTCGMVMRMSLTPAGCTGVLRSSAGFEWRPVWQQRHFSSGCWVTRPCLVTSMQILIVSKVRLEFQLDGYMVFTLLPPMQATLYVYTITEKICTCYITTSLLSSTSNPRSSINPNLFSLSLLV